jgi:hypothetical protein
LRLVQRQSALQTQVLDYTQIEQINCQLPFTLVRSVYSGEHIEITCGHTCHPVVKTPAFSPAT